MNLVEQQLTLEDLLKNELRQRESVKPWFLQIPSARLVKFKGDSSGLGSLVKGTLGVVVGSITGEFDTAFHSGRALRNVKYIDLEPMKVTEFTKEEKEMEWPKTLEMVKVISNATMQVVDEGLLMSLYPDKCCLKDKLNNGDFSKESRWHDLTIHHFEGYQPKRLLVWKDEII